MNSWTLFLAAFAALAATAVAEKKIVCYFGSWAVYRPGDGKFDISNIDPTLCTHMIYTFVGMDAENGDVKVLDGWQDLPDNYGKNGFGRFNALREKSPGTKTLIAIGGWNEGSAKYSLVVNNPNLRAKFVQNVVKFVKKHNFDGFDVDWEYPNQRGGKPEDKENYVALLRELRQAFDQEGLILSAAVGAAESSASQSYIISEMSKHLHFINLMTYDLHGAWESVTGLNAPLYPASRESGNQAKLNVDSAVRYWLDNGAPAEKLILGVPFYGRGFTLANAQNNGVGAATNGPASAGPFTREAGMLGYNEICTNIQRNGWTVHYDEEQRVPYAVKGNQWVGFDDVKSLTEKSYYIKDLGLGGAMLWSIETDDFQGHCGEKYPLLKTLNHVLRNGASVPAGKPPVTHTQSPVEPTQTPVDPVTPTQAPVEPQNPVDGNKVCQHDGYVRDPQDCTKFYFCQNINGSYKATPFSCGAGLAFDPNLLVCNYKDQVQC